MMSRRERHHTFPREASPSTCRRVASCAGFMERFLKMLISASQSGSGSSSSLEEARGRSGSRERRGASGRGAREPHGLLLGRTAFLPWEAAGLAIARAEHAALTIPGAISSTIPAEAGAGKREDLFSMGGSGWGCHTQAVRELICARAFA